MANRLVVTFLLVQLVALGSVNNVCAQKGLKVFISVDMEGIAGIVSSEQVTVGGAGYEPARLWMTKEANAAIQGALDAGATEILVNDSHGTMRNLLPHELNPAARLITGSPKPYSMMQGLDESFDAAIFIGYHSRAGSADALLDHTYSSSTVYSLKVNGMEVGESELNAIIAAQFGVPVVMISGDKTLCNQVRSLLDKNIVTVVVKEGIGRNAANTLVPAEAQKVIREGASTALKKVKDIKPFRVAGPYKFEIDFLNSYQAEAAELIPGIERTGPRTVSYSNSNFLDGFRLFRAILVLAAN